MVRHVQAKVVEEGRATREVDRMLTGRCCFLFFGPDPILWSQSLRLQDVKSPTAGIDGVGKHRGKDIREARSDYVRPDRRPLA